jgi:uncharacterized protein with HEPN domain
MLGEPLKSAQFKWQKGTETNENLNSHDINSEKRFATIKQIEIIGEACNQQ